MNENRPLIAPQARVLSDWLKNGGDTPLQSIFPTMPSIVEKRAQMQEVFAVLIDEIMGFAQKGKYFVPEDVLNEVVETDLPLRETITMYAAKAFNLTTGTAAVYLAHLHVINMMKKSQNQKIEIEMGINNRTVELYDRATKLAKAVSMGTLFTPEPLPMRIERGIATSWVFLRNLFALVPELSQSTDPHVNMRIAHNSYPLVAEFSKLGINTFANINDLCEIKSTHGRGFDDKYFDRTKFKLIGGNAVDINSYVRSAMDITSHANRRDTITGCPARVNFGEGSAIARQWSCFTRAADLIYRAKLPAAR